MSKEEGCSDNARSRSGSSGGGAEIKWDEKQNLFKTSDGRAYLEYVIKPVSKVLGNKDHSQARRQVMLMNHTYVPSAFRGQGVAARLCVTAFQHCKDKGLLVLPVCTYISDTFLPRNPEWDDLVLKDQEHPKPGL